MFDTKKLAVRIGGCGSTIRATRGVLDGYAGIVFISGKGRRAFSLSGKV